MKKGEFDDAVRRALNLFDRWNDVAGFFVKGTGYYYEIQSVITDAVHCGAQAETRDFRPLDGEEELDHVPGAPGPRPPTEGTP